MNLSHLYYFKKLAEVKHYTNAANELYIAQPTLSIAMSHLEEELGAPLFERKKGSIELTESGEVFYRAVSEGLTCIDKGILDVRERMGLISGSLNLGTLYAMQDSNWSKAIHAFHEEYGTTLQINITQGFSPVLTDKLLSGELDVLFASKVSDNDNLRYIPVWAQQLVLCVNKRHPLADKQSVSLADLKDYHNLSYMKSSPVSDELEAVLEGLDLDIDRSFDNEITLSSLVTSNADSVALLCYSFLVQAFDEVVYIPIDDVPKDFHRVYLIYRADESRMRVVDGFIEFMSRYHFPTAEVPRQPQRSS